MKTPAITTEIVRIGNSHGVRIPKSVREQAGLRGRVSMIVSGGALVIRSAKRPREGWDDAFARAATRGRPESLWPENMTSRFDESEWTW